MQVLHLSCQYLPSLGGVELHLRDLCQGLRAAGVDARVLVLDRTFDDPGRRLPRAEVLDGVPVRRVPFLRFGTYFLAPAVLGALGRPDALHIHNTEFFLDILPLLRRVTGAPVVLTPHGGYFHTASLATLKALHARTLLPRRLAQVDRVLASAGDGAFFATMVPPERLRYVSPIVRWQAFAAVRAAGPGILHLGRIVPHKRVDRLLDLLEDVPELGPLHLVGDDRGMDALLRRRCDVLGARVHRHGVLPADGLRAVMARCRFVVSASAYEGFGLSLVEGMAAGLVPLANGALPSFRTIVTDRVDGVLVPFGDRAAAATRVRSALGAPLAALAERARAASRRYGATEVVAAHQAIYAEVRK